MFRRGAWFSNSDAEDTFFVDPGIVVAKHNFEAMVEAALISTLQVLMKASWFSSVGAWAQINVVLRNSILMRIVARLSFIPVLDDRAFLKPQI